MKRLITGILLMLMAVLTVEMVSAAYDCDMMSTATTAGTSDTYKRGASANISANVTGRDSNPYNLTTAEISINTGTISGALLQNDTTAPIGNVSDFDDLNFTVDTIQLSDDTTYTLTITLKNETQQTEGTCTLSIIPDNTIPVCTHSQLSKTTYSPKQTWKITSANVSSAELQFGSNSPYTMTESSTDVFTYTTKEGQLPEGTYTIKGTTNDGLNSTVCLLDYVRIDSEAKLRQMATLASQGQKGEQVTTTVTNNNNSLAILLIIGAAVYFFISRKK